MASKNRCFRYARLDFVTLVIVASAVGSQSRLPAALDLKPGYVESLGFRRYAASVCGVPVAMSSNHG